MGKIDVTYFEDIAQEVKELHQAFHAIDGSNLTADAIVVLLQHATKEKKSSIINVLWGLQNINRYIKKDL